MSKKYKVIALSVGGKNNKIFKAGDEVTADMFPGDNAEALVKEGFLKPIEVEADKKSEDSKEEDPKEDVKKSKK